MTRFTSSSSFMICLIYYLETSEGPSLRSHRRHFWRMVELFTSTCQPLGTELWTITPTSLILLYCSSMEPKNGSCAPKQGVYTTRSELAVDTYKQNEPSCSVFSQTGGCLFSAPLCTQGTLVFFATECGSFSSIVGYDILGTPLDIRRLERKRDVSSRACCQTR